MSFVKSFYSVVENVDTGNLTSKGCGQSVRFELMDSQSSIFLSISPWVGHMRLRISVSDTKNRWSLCTCQNCSLIWFCLAISLSCFPHKNPTYFSSCHHRNFTVPSLPINRISLSGHALTTTTLITKPAAPSHERLQLQQGHIT